MAMATENKEIVRVRWIILCRSRGSGDFDCDEASFMTVAIG